MSLITTQVHKLEFLIAVLFDTGSGDILLPGSNCTENCAGHTLYNASASSTSNDLHTNFTFSFGTGVSVSEGEGFTDTFTVAGLTVCCLFYSLYFLSNFTVI
jgi:hypothetical protein